MTVFEIDEAILGCVDPESGEIIDIDRLMELQMERAEKLENVACWVVDLAAETKAIKEQEAVLKARREAAERRAESLKRFLADALKGEKFKTGRISVSYRKSTSTEIDEGTELPEEFRRVKTIVEADKAAIKEALTAGADIPGCRLVTKTSVVVK